MGGPCRVPAREHLHAGSRPSRHHLPQHACAALFPRRVQPSEAPARLALGKFPSSSVPKASPIAKPRMPIPQPPGLDICPRIRLHRSWLPPYRPERVPPPARRPEAASHLLEALLMVARTQGLLKARGRRRTDSIHVWAAIRVLTGLKGRGWRRSVQRCTASPGWHRPGCRRARCRGV